MAEVDPIADLFARAALRDPRAFAQLYKHCCGRLYAVALRIVRRHDWAEEVLQESFVNIWHHMGEYSAQKSAPMTWMTAIVRNRALDWLRRPRLEHGSDDFDLLIEAVADTSEGPEGRLMATREARRLSDCLATLNAAQRQSITLAYLHGLSHGELAAHLREPLGTVKTWIRRGLEKLRGCLERTPT
ncbi:MAG TPA: sigma-70 family RNA polymerase sigma factor [Burkholderiales bacterium]|nr:sigma-70 family RNA polymerase sigma factor [Burkholderiales bacterium]